MEETAAGNDEEIAFATASEPARRLEGRKLTATRSTEIYLAAGSATT